MDKWEALKDISWYWIAGGFAILECGKWIYSLLEWLISKFGIETKSMRQKREVSERLKKAEQDIVEIKDTAKANVTMFLDHEKKVINSFIDIKEEVVRQLNGLNVKFDEQRSQLEEKLEDIDRDGKARDCAIFRDRIIQSTRYFNQQRNEDGYVYLSISDYENLQNLFAEYFSANGNGVVHSIYEQDFLKNFRVDSTSLNIHK